MRELRSVVHSHRRRDLLVGSRHVTNAIIGAPRLARRPTNAKGTALAVPLEPMATRARWQLVQRLCRIGLR
ncbi:hypothetical protein DB30_01654 [Enhygromyxa salina]|uniref:Uncharacterized protein n=1 Tax=Enhygromyxa salina TaxID=215803 RepID=A0A0C2D970_9BACT|nr:hypothetical protein DB30_01654 [Enhygromyxa salina]